MAIVALVLAVLTAAKRADEQLDASARLRREELDELHVIALARSLGVAFLLGAVRCRPP